MLISDTQNLFQIKLKMNQELQMSLTKYLQIKDKLVPKHLTTNEPLRKKESLRKKILAESPGEIIKKAKKKYLRPIGQIETIMKHFDSKFGNRRASLIESIQRTKKRRGPSLKTEGSNSERELQTRMAYLINLPFIGKVKKEAQKYREKVNAQILKEKELRKMRIMQEFNRYMEAELKGNPRTSLNKRINTIH